MAIPLAANEVQKTDLIPGFTNHAPEYALLASVGVGLFGGAVMLAIGILNFIEQRRINNRMHKVEQDKLDELERHHRAMEPKA